MSEGPTLSICIPTYNRATYLEETLNNIVSEIQKMPEDQRGKIDLCISDNHSTDGTKDVVRKIMDQSPVHVTFNVNAKNLGPDVNFINSVSLSNSDYVWLLGSDDKITDGGLTFLYNFLDTHQELDLIFLNKETFKSDGVTLIDSPYQSNKGNEIVFFTNPLQASLEVIYEAGLISILCFRRVKWESVTGFEKFLNSWYVHQYKFLSMLRDGSSSAWIRFPSIVAYRGGNESVVNREVVLKRIGIMLHAFYSIPESVFGSHSTEHRLITSKMIDLNFHSLNILFDVSRVSIKQRLSLIKTFYKYCKSFSFFYIKILPFLIIPIGSNGKFLFGISVDAVAKRFHRF